MTSRRSPSGEAFGLGEIDIGLGVVSERSEFRFPNRAAGCAGLESPPVAARAVRMLRRVTVTRRRYFGMARVASGDFRRESQWNRPMQKIRHNLEAPAARPGPPHYARIDRRRRGKVAECRVAQSAESTGRPARRNCRWEPRPIWNFKARMSQLCRYAWRNTVWRVAAVRKFPRQVVLYVGEAPLAMESELRGPEVSFRYRTIDIRDLDATACWRARKPGIM